MNTANREKAIRIMNGVVAGTTDQTSSAVDTQGYDGVKFYTAFGAITAGAVTSVKVQQSSDDGAVDTYADLTGTAITVADDDDNQLTVHDIYRPRERYLKVVVDRGVQNAVIDGVIAVLYGAKEMPTISDSATVVARETHVSPAEGTA
jgi:predicted ribosome-associated RNA-binding protein Tma20